MLDEQHTRTLGIVGVVDHFGDVPLFGAHLCERLDPGSQRAPLRHRSLVRGALRFGTRVDDLLQALVTERAAHRRDELDGEVVVTIGEQILGQIGQRPHGRRPSPPRRRPAPRRDEAVVGQRVEMLAHARLGHVERLARGRPTVASARFKRSTIRRLVGAEVRGNLGA